MSDLTLLTLELQNKINEENIMQKQNNKSIEQLISVWQQAKANADTSRAILELDKKEEREAREVVEKALRSAGWGEI